MTNMHVKTFFENSKEIIDKLSIESMNLIVDNLVQIRNIEGRLFFLGVGGGAGHASHAVNDFRKIAGIECYTPSDNVSELTARINDDGWDTCYVNWLLGSKLCSKDGVFVFSVGGGNKEKNISNNVVLAIEHATKVGAKIFGVVGRDGGYTAEKATACVVVPTVNANTITPQTESFQAFVWHCIVSHPDLAINEMKWESVK